MKDEMILVAFLEITTEEGTMNGPEFVLPVHEDELPASAVAALAGMEMVTGSTEVGRARISVSLYCDHRNGSSSAPEGSTSTMTHWREAGSWAGERRCLEDPGY